MLRTIEAVIDKQGGVRLLEPVHLSEERRLLKTGIGLRRMRHGHTCSRRSRLSAVLVF